MPIASTSAYRGVHLAPLVVLFAIPLSVIAGASATAPRFAAARVRQATGAEAYAAHGLFGPRGQYVARNTTLVRIAAVAYDIEPFQIRGGPEWVRSDRFDIDATAADLDASPEAMRRMVQALLTEKFGLMLQRTDRPTEMFRLQRVRSDGRLGPRLRASAACPPGGPRTESCGLVGGPGHLNGTGITMAQFARGLGPHVQRVVVDRSGLEGRFSLDLDYAPLFGAAPPSDAPASQRPPGTGPSLVRALEEQLGLTLVPAVASISGWWIEDVERLHAE